MTDHTKPECPSDYYYLIGTTHIDNENGTKYLVTRIVIHSGYIAAYRSSVLANGQRSRFEDDTPIHVKDIVLMTASSNLNSDTTIKSVVCAGIPTQSSVDNTPGKSTPVPSSHYNNLSSLKRKLVASRSEKDASGISSHGELLDPYALTKQTGQHNTRKTVRFDTSSTRERTKRILMNVNKMGDIASHMVAEDNTEKTSAYSTFRAFHTMIENNEFDIDFVPKTYKEAMQSNDSMRWQQAVDKELQSINDNNVFSIVDRPPGIKLQSGRFLFTFYWNSISWKRRLMENLYQLF